MPVYLVSDIYVLEGGTPGKGGSAYICNIISEVEALKLFTVVESFFPDRLKPMEAFAVSTVISAHRIEPAQFWAVGKGFSANSEKIGGYGDFCQIFKTAKKAFGYFFDTAAQSHLFQGSAALEDVFAYDLDGIGDRNSFQRGAVSKGSIFNLY